MTKQQIIQTHKQACEMLGIPCLSDTIIYRMINREQTEQHLTEKAWRLYGEPQPVRYAEDRLTKSDLKYLNFAGL